MERNSILYKIRRKLQVIGYYIFSKEYLSKIYFKIILNQKLNLQDPKTFNEKLQWLKLYYYPYNSLVVKCTDKYTVREYIISKGYKDKLVPLLGVWDNPDEIDWDFLPEKFVLKCNHGCAYNILISNKKEANKIKVKKQLKNWLKEDFGKFNIESHYSKIKEHKIICEEFLGECITDYKFFCFNGVPKYIYVSNNLINDRQAKIGFFYLNGKKMSLYRDDYNDIENIEMPLFFEEMKKMATDLATDFQFVRVDFFLANNTYYFAELTFTPSACMMPFNPIEYDLEWGNLLKIKE